MGMGDCKFGCMKGKLPLFLNAISFVGINRATLVCKMNSDLILSTGEKGDFKKALKVCLLYHLVSGA